MKRWLPLLVITLLGVYLRFDRLTTIPPSLSHDETAIAYNAYSILKTTSDEYGKPFPILFRSFDDYKLPGMVYATIPFVALFGKGALAARLPSAIFGVLSIILMYGLSIELLGDKRWIHLGKKEFDAALLPPLAFAVSPWHINFSRQLFESNGAVFWFMLGTHFLLRSRKDYKDILWAGLSYVVSLYFYYSVRLVIPFMLLLYVCNFWNTITKQWKTTVFALVVCLLAFLPLGKEMLSPGGLERISIVSVINDPNYIKRREDYVQKMGAHPTLINKVIYNRRVALIKTVIENYGKNISPHNLFVTGTGTYGALYPFEILLIPLGFLSLLSLSPFGSLLVCVWLISAFLPGALSVNQPNTLRTLIAAPSLAILSGLGVVQVIIFLSKKSINRIFVIFTVIASFTWIVHEFPKFHYAYFVNNPSNNAVAFGDGNKQMVEYVKKHENEYDQIYVSGYYWRPYIFLLYWGNMDPAEYQQTGSREKFGKYMFTSASWDTSGIKLMDPSFDPNTLEASGKTLFILSPQELEVQKKHFKEIDQINGRRADRVFVAAVQQ